VRMLLPEGQESLVPMLLANLVNDRQEKTENGRRERLTKELQESIPNIRPRKQEQQPLQQRSNPQKAVLFLPVYWIAFLH